MTAPRKTTWLFLHHFLFYEKKRGGGRR